jgi:superfamily II DNA or RNA helicase
MELRPYQQEAVARTLKCWTQYDRVLGVASTGAGKTVIAAAVIQSRLAQGPALFLAHRDELLSQAIDKLQRATGIVAAREQAINRAGLSDSVVVASVQSLHAARLEGWPRDHFRTLIIDECHRSAAKIYRTVLEHFTAAKTLGITATPDRSDQRSLGEIFEEIAFEIELPELIEQGYLAPIRVETLPLQVDLAGVGLDSRGDIDVTQAGGVVAPYLDALAAELVQRRDRKTLVFLPLVELSKRFAAAARAQGLAAEHVDGNSPDRKEILARYANNETRLLSCSALLLEGWDEPSIDCVCIMRPTQSRTVYVQALGRGTRIHKGKDHLLVLDPLWLSSEHQLVRPANLVSRDAVEAQVITEALSAEPDLLRAKQRAKEVSLAELQARAAQLAAQLKVGSRRERQIFDALEASATFAVPELANFEPVVVWHSEPLTSRQGDSLRAFGIDPASVRNRGHGSLILDHLHRRRRANLASYRQLRFLVRFGHPQPLQTTFEEASAFLDRRFGTRRKTRFHPPRTAACAQQQQGNVQSFCSKFYDRLPRHGC